MPADDKKRAVKVCISITPKLNKKIIQVQSEMMKATGKSYSFSRAVSDVLEEHFK